MADLCYEVSKLEDCDELTEFLRRSFFAREPMTVGLHMTWEDRRHWVEKSVPAWATTGVSYLCRDKAKGNKLVGCSLSKLITCDDGATFAGYDMKVNEKLRTYHHILHELETCHNFFETDNVNKILEFLPVSVDEEYGGKGIATKLVQLSEQQGKELGAQLAATEATNFISQKLYSNLGYETRYVLDYATYEFEGKRMFDTEALGKSVCAKFLTKRL